MKKYNTDMKNNSLISQKISKTLSEKLASEYTFSRNDYASETTPSEIINQAYKKASDLFDSESETSIVTFTLKFYMQHIDEAIELYIDDMDDYQAISKLLQAYSKINLFMRESNDSFESMLAKELLDNQDYYRLFPINYYKELYHTSDLDIALAELTHDVNIRAFTYYNSAHKTYLDYLPGLEEIIVGLFPSLDQD
ncbi:hypothetical protein [Butyrivibrio sp. NC2007]|uniref:hypothetical protein n=1 Tax=Butyrivibrio sp. NC2007 TaxID=1280683 RepID=UPI0012DDC828|nr:hypothetical protein [Butyrivibrio sp. NC2007]